MRTLAAALLVSSLAACGSSGDDEVTVFAAASLTEAFTELASAFEARTGVEVALNFAGSSELAAQIADGAPADVFASADAVTMERVVTDGDIAGQPATFATNELVLLVEPGNPLDVSGPEALADDDLVVVLCAIEVPCGRYAADVVANAGIVPAVDSYEANVKGVVAKIALGEADLGVAYRTDGVAAGDEVEMIEIAPDVNVEATYPILPLGAAGRAGAEFIEFVVGPDGQEILADHGFGQP